ncbi:hypothetical protein CDAR_469241 [Caerostris darwini]|uniref:C3H1-type domain-containing protein n=1 Tax=Caerostris darwini TaxID=1538125 RepID=A0AAV4Q571_9ARAC|nr:hypothetical protein CDAR_469241 [Caerostris darwini]
MATYDELTSCDLRSRDENSYRFYEFKTIHLNKRLMNADEKERLVVEKELDDVRKKLIECIHKIGLNTCPNENCPRNHLTNEKMRKHIVKKTVSLS